LKPNKVASLPEVAHVPLLPVPLPEALALYMKKEHNYVSKITKIHSKEKQR
jgi:hypothetical protein